MKQQLTNAFVSTWNSQAIDDLNDTFMTYKTPQMNIIKVSIDGLICFWYKIVPKKTDLRSVAKQSLDLQRIKERVEYMREIANSSNPMSRVPSDVREDIHQNLNRRHH